MKSSSIFETCLLCKRHQHIQMQHIDNSYVNIHIFHKSFAACKHYGQTAWLKLTTFHVSSSMHAISCTKDSCKIHAREYLCTNMHTHIKIHTHTHAQTYFKVRISTIIHAYYTRSYVHMQHTNIGLMWSTMTCTPEQVTDLKNIKSSTSHQCIEMSSISRYVIYFDTVYVFLRTHSLAGLVDIHITGLGVEVKYRREQAQMGMFKKLFTRTKPHGEPAVC
jgi:hypothetical protein